MDRQIWRIRRKISTETVSGGIADLAFFSVLDKKIFFACVGFLKKCFAIYRLGKVNAF
jgi:hypothetical protein